MLRLEEGVSTNLSFWRSLTVSGSITIPVTVTPEAAARLAELGMQPQLEQMLEHTRQTILRLKRLQVELAEPYDTGSEPGITIWGYCDQPYLPGDLSRRAWGNWKVTTFPPEVCQHF